MKNRSIAFSARDLFWKHVDKSAGDDGCWLWTSRKHRGGYGEFTVQRSGKQFYWRAHRVSYELEVGPIPDGLLIDHLCRVRSCVNPRHLDPVTHQENMRRGRGYGWASRREACGNGHKWTDESTLIDRRGIRVCRLCSRDRFLRWKQRQADAS